VDDRAIVAVLDEAAAAVRTALDGLEDWGPSGGHQGQYRFDVVADAAALGVLHGAGLAVLSEESGHTGPDGHPVDDLLVVLDPVDGSTNASLGLPWYATSLCVLDAEGPRAAVVVNQASGIRYEAVRGEGARRDGQAVSPSGCTVLGEAVIAVTGFPSGHPGWSQLRVLGSAALDICAVAEGVLDGYAVVGRSYLHSWDYLGALLVATEAGAVADDLGHEDLVVREAARRRPVVGATPRLLEALVAKLA